MSIDGPPRRGLTRNGRRAPRVTIDDQGAVEVPQLTVAVGGDAVAAVPVVVETEAAEPHPEVPLERGARLEERGVRRWYVGAVPAGEPGFVDHPLVHPAPALLPRRSCDQDLEHLVGTAEPLA